MTLNLAAALSKNYKNLPAVDSLDQNSESMRCELRLVKNVKERKREENTILLVNDNIRLSYIKLYEDQNKKVLKRITVFEAKIVDKI